MAEFGENFKKAREAKGWTQQTLADKLYVTRQAVSRWECGSRFPDLLTAKKAADYLGVSMDSLLSQDDFSDASEKLTVFSSPVIKKLQMLLYGFAALLSLSQFINIVVSLISKYSDFINSEAKLYETVYSAGILIMTGMFIYALVLSFGDSLTPFKSGIVMTVYFITNCVKIFSLPYASYSSAGILTVKLLPFFIGAVCAALSFCFANKSILPICGIVFSCLWHFMITAANFLLLIIDSPEFAVQNTLIWITETGVAVLFVFEAVVLYRKRKAERYTAADIQE